MKATKLLIVFHTIVRIMGNNGKDRITVTISPYVKEKLKKYVGKGKKFSSNSDAANTALIELFSRIEML
ncbi:MAG TPA: hypothetical protein VFM18_22135, partial [Methanosarcina sp.]|nr:hypothetical protein [Methanosarcina sp.]